MKRRLSVTNLSSKNNLKFWLNAPVVIRAKVTGAFSWNVGKLFSELKLVTDNLLLIYAEETERLVIFVLVLPFFEWTAVSPAAAWPGSFRNQGDGTSLVEACPHCPSAAACSFVTPDCEGGEGWGRWWRWGGEEVREVRGWGGKGGEGVRKVREVRNMRRWGVKKVRKWGKNECLHMTFIYVTVPV